MELVRRPIEVARGEKLRRVIANIISENQAMLKLATRFHLKVTPRLRCMTRRDARHATR
jgi:RimJ/RimL family protein N-acetyltransferase